ncbi:hypothetical protein P3L10_028484 [Capsicum annuum]
MLCNFRKKWRNGISISFKGLLPSIRQLSRFKPTGPSLFAPNPSLLLNISRKGDPFLFIVDLSDYLLQLVFSRTSKFKFDFFSPRVVAVWPIKGGFVHAYEKT